MPYSSVASGGTPTTELFTYNTADKLAQKIVADQTEKTERIDANKTSINRPLVDAAIITSDQLKSYISRILDHQRMANYRSDGLLWKGLSIELAELRRC